MFTIARAVVYICCQFTGVTSPCLTLYYYHISCFCSAVVWFCLFSVSCYALYVGESQGTTQIQGLDLLGRKVLLNKLRPLNEHSARQRQKLWTIVTSTDGATRKRALGLYMEMFKWQFYTARIGKNAMADRESVGVAATDYLMYAGYVQLTMHWLMMEAAAKKALAGPEALRGQERGFYEAKIAMSEFVYEELFPHTRRLSKTMFTPTKAVMQMSPESFSFDYAQN